MCLITTFSTNSEALVGIDRIAWHWISGIDARPDTEIPNSIPVFRTDAEIIFSLDTDRITGSSLVEIIFE